MRKNLQNNKGYAEPPEFLPALGLFIFKKKSVATKLEVNLIPSSLDYKKNCTHAQTPTRLYYPTCLRATNVLHQEIRSMLHMFGR